jgi:hypothetical protein
MKCFKRKKPLFSEEDLLQRAIVDYLRLSMTKGIVYHINNDGETRIKRMRNASIGVLSGVADLHVVWAGGHGYIEVKLPKKTSVQKPSQIEFEKTCKALKVPYAVCRSLDDVTQFVLDNKIPNRISNKR